MSISRQQLYSAVIETLLLLLKSFVVALVSAVSPLHQRRHVSASGRNKLKKGAVASRFLWNDWGKGKRAVVNKGELPFFFFYNMDLISSIKYNRLAYSPT